MNASTTQAVAAGAAAGGVGIGSVILTILAGYAIYLSFKCNNGFNVWGFLAALFLPFFYIPYKLATMPKKCGLK
jgi:ABC-type glycerol-3-phosphate transport system permease component